MNAAFPSYIKLAAFDLDGVVYTGMRPVPGAAETIDTLRKRGVQIRFLTNNSARSRQEIVDRLNGFGVGCVLDEIYTSSHAALEYVRSSSNGGRRVFVLGQPYLSDEFRSAGFTVGVEPPYDFFVMGFKMDFNYEDIARGFEALEHSRTFVICNRDRLFPVEGGKLRPASGSMVAALETASGRKPNMEIGKPNTYMLERIAEKRQLAPREIMMVGDSLASDMRMAVDFGAFSVHVDSSRLHAYEKAAQTETIHPDLTVRSIAELIV